MRTLSILGVLLAATGCTTSGEHQSTAHICDNGGAGTLAPQTVDTIQVELTRKLEGAGLTSCTWARPRPLQLGAHPVAWFCGKLGDTPVEASINRPGMRACAIELDLRADVSGTTEKITRLEAPVIAYRDDVLAWFRQNVKRWWEGASPAGRGDCCPSTGRTDTILGDPPR